MGVEQGVTLIPRTHIRFIRPDPSKADTMPAGIYTHVGSSAHSYGPMVEHDIEYLVARMKYSSPPEAKKRANAIILDMQRCGHAELHISYYRTIEAIQVIAVRLEESEVELIVGANSAGAIMKRVRRTTA